MNLILAVVEDLYLFARDAFLSILPSQKQRPTLSPPALPARAHHEEISAPAPRVVASENVEEPSETPDAHEEKESEEDVPLTFRSTAEILDAPLRPQKNTVMYTGSDATPIFRNPAMEFDGVMTRMPYGSMVMVLEGKGRWARVAYKNTEGWVLRDELLDRSAYVYPDFTVGVANESDDPNTLRVRACIGDEFGGGVAELPLHASEYILYRLGKKGVSVPWTLVRPRVEGSWHTLLKGAPNVHIGVQPCAGCVMEYEQPDGSGHVVYVEAVFPDETISLSEVNYPERGIYNERIVPKEEWREWKPIFIHIQ